MNQKLDYQRDNYKDIKMKILNINLLLGKIL